ncbi:hypothetical protein [Acidovorax carolinensis]|uniref:hypothetical protein n=1 Tax=Acidovorax carolinensis TaxID=553814 RepID=UPI0012FF965C|nr:hypothetical protein [Acidovorax carolinensis]
MDSTTTVVVQVEPAPPNPEHIEDISMLFGLFLVAAVVIACARGLLNLFRVDHAKD